MKKILALLLTVSMVASIGMISFAFPASSSDYDYKLSDEQSRILEEITGKSQNSTVKPSVKSVKPIPNQATEVPATTKNVTDATKAEAVEKYFAKYFKNTVMAISLTDTLSDDVDLNFDSAKFLTMNPDKMCVYYYDTVLAKYYLIFDMSKHKDYATATKYIESDQFEDDFKAVGIDSSNVLSGYMLITDGVLVRK